MSIRNDDHFAGRLGERREDATGMKPTRALLAEDALIFGLRMNAGVELAPWRERCPEAPWAEVSALLDRLAQEGLAEQAGGVVRLTDRGRLVADAIGAEVMAAFATESVAR